MTQAAGKDSHVQQLLGMYVLGALSPDEHVAVEDHLAECGVCRTECAELGEVSAFLDLLSQADVDALAEAFPLTPAGSAPEVPQVPHVPPPRAAPSARPSAGAPPTHGPPSGTAPAGRPAGRGARPAGSARRGRALGGRPVRVVLAAVAIALVLGVGVGVWLTVGSTGSTVAFAGSEANAATGVSMSVSVAAQGNGSHVDATVNGLTAGVEYQLYAVDAAGHTMVVARWVPDHGSQAVSGDIPTSVSDLAFFSVAEQGGAVLVTLRLAAADRATPRSP